jgi:lipid-binding SYLF domain-containing protein
MKAALRIPVFLLLLALSLAVHSEPTAELDQSASAALNDLYASSSAASALGAKAKAVLVFPDLRTSSFVVGAQAGDGVMFRDGQVAGYYSIGGVAAGLEAGAQSYSYALFFMSDAALQRLRDSSDFDTSGDPDIAFVDVLGETSLTGDVSLEGLTITQVDR